MSGYRTEFLEMQEGFHSFLKHNNDYTSGPLLGYKDAAPGVRPLSMFLNPQKGDRRTMGIMFHGTHRDNIGSICRDGLNYGSSFTSSLDYAVGRSAFKERSSESGRNDDVRVLAMAVLVKDKSKIGGKDERIEEPYFSLPLYVLTVQLSRS